MNKYSKLYGWMYEAFGDKEFSIDDFRAVFPSSHPAKVIHDLIKLNYLDRVKRGTYRVTTPKELVERIVKEDMKKEDVLKNVRKKYAYCNNDAVSIWTKGYYSTGFTAGFKPIHIKVLNKDIDWWNNFFKENNVEYLIEGENKTLFGLSYILHPKRSFRKEMKDDAPIIPLSETVKFCKENELTYWPALEYLDVNFNLGLFETHEHL